LKELVSYSNAMLPEPLTFATSHIDRLADEAWSYRNSNVTKAFELSGKALEQAKAAYYSKGIAGSLMIQAFCMFRRSDYEQARHLAQAALKIFSTLDDATGKQRVLNIMGIVEAESGNLTEALRMFMQNQKLSQEMGDKQGEINAYNNIAVVYGYLGDYASALECHTKSLPLIHEIGFRTGEMQALINIAVLHIHLENPSEALEYLERSLEFRSDGELHTYAVALLNFAKAHVRLGNYQQALEHGQEHLKLTRELEDKASVAYSLYELGHIHLRMGDSVQAEAYFLENLEMLRDVGDPKGRAETKILLAELYLARQSFTEAEEMLHRALEIARSVGAKGEETKVHQLFSSVYEQQGKFEKSLEHIKLYLSLRDAIANESSKKRFEALQIKFEIEQTEREKEFYRTKNLELAQKNMELERLSKELDKQANEDGLTGIFNRRRLEQELQREVERARRTGDKLSVLICDIDNFKQVNDRFSHQTGDKVLIEVARILKQNMRGVDMVARYGGEEFVALFPNTSAKEAFTICDRLRDLIAKAPWADIHAELHITLSMGLCDDLSLADGFAMLDQADERLYDAKRRGKNRVVY
jgi:diguanylate cyclase (GGDEF)-like protein